MKPLHTACLLLSAFFLQTTAVKLTVIGGAGPNLLLCSALVLVVKAREPAPVIGLCVLTAVLQELCFSLYAGPAPAAMFTACITTAFAGNFLALEHPLFLAGLTVVQTLLYNGVLWGVSAILGAPYDFLYVLRIQPVYILYNLVLMVFFYFLFLNKTEGRYSR